MIQKLASFAFLALLVAGGLYAYYATTEQRREVEQRDKKIAEQRAAIERLTRNRRVAQAIVVSRWTDAKTGKVFSRVRFVEIDADGKPLKTTEGVVEGESVYFDALVLKFDGEKVAAGDPLKGRSVLLFRRMFGDRQKPVDGVSLDETDEQGVPRAYRGREAITAAERELWAMFWRFAEDPKVAAAEGVRVAQGEAPYTRLEEGKLYELTLDDAGGLNVGVAPIPPVLLPSGN